MNELPKTPNFLINGAAIPTPEPDKMPRPQLGPRLPRKEEMSKKREALLLAGAMEKLHYDATDSALSNHDRVSAAHKLGMLMNDKFFEVIWALRVAGGARRP